MSVSPAEERITAPVYEDIPEEPDENTGKTGGVQELVMGANHKSSSV